MIRAAALTTLIAATLAVAGCGGESPSAGAVAPAVDAPAAASVEVTDGRLGDATAAVPGATRELSRGGAPDLSERDDAPSRDGVGAGAACAGSDLAPTAANIAAVAAATLCLLNGERADRGLAPLAANAQLAAAAGAYAQDLVAGSYFSHTGRDGSDILDRIKRTGYIRDDRAWRIGENLAWGTGALATPAAIMQAWMNSPGHRENILNGAYREIGVGVVAGNPQRTDGAGATYATEFGAIEGAQADVVTTAPAQPGVGKKATSSKKKAKKARRGGARAKKARGKRARSARARHARARVTKQAATAEKGRGGKARKTRRVKGRGPIARIAI